MRRSVRGVGLSCLARAHCTGLAAYTETCSLLSKKHAKTKKASYFITMCTKRSPAPISDAGLRLYE